MISNVSDFICECKMMLRDGVIMPKVINGEIIRCSNFENEKIEIIKPLNDYSMIVNMKSQNQKNTVIALDKEGYVSKIDSNGWKQLAENLELV